MNRLPTLFERKLPRLFNDRDWFSSTFDLFESMLEDFDSAFGRKCCVKDNTVSYEFEVPGFNKDNLTVDIADGFVTINGEREVGDSKRKIFERIQVGEVEDVKASMKDGLLTLKVIYPEIDKKKVNIDVE